jgi:hypothetical protein
MSDKGKFAGAVLVAIAAWGVGRELGTWAAFAQVDNFISFLGAIGAVIVAGRYVDSKSQGGGVL